MTTPSFQYFVNPPSVPLYLSGRTNNLRGLIAWAKEEYQRGIICATRKGYYKTLKILSEEYSPIRLLAEMKGYRGICSRITKKDWDELTGRERVFIRRAYELRDYLLRT